MTTNTQRASGIAVVGGGATGLIASLALAAAGAEVTLVAPGRSHDPRTTALMDSSVNILKALDVWSRLESQVAPLRTMRLVDGTKRLLRAPEVSFQSDELGLDAFAWNLENEVLLAALDTAVAANRAIVRRDARAIGVRLSPAGASVDLDDGTSVPVALVAAADGRDSPCRRSAGIAMRTRSYPQVAVTATFAHRRPHNDISTEFHTETGPFTLVPLTGNRCSVVCVVSPREAETLLALDAAAFARDIERRAHSILGAMTLDGPRGSFPLSVRTAGSLSAERLVLLGEAAHLLPPIGAQGLNLGVRDAATLAEQVDAALKAGEDVGSVADGFEARRRGDVDSRTVAIDLFNRSLLSDFLSVQGARGLSLWLLGRSSTLRRAAMREGVGPARNVPPRLS